jgi:hypothetical protein
MTETLASPNRGEHLIGKTVYWIDDDTSEVKKSLIVKADEGTDVDKLWYSGKIEGVKPMPTGEKLSATFSDPDEFGKTLMYIENGPTVSGTIEKIEQDMSGPSTDVGGTVRWNVFVPNIELAEEAAYAAKPDMDRSIALKKEANIREQMNDEDDIPEGAETYSPQHVRGLRDLSQHHESLANKAIKEVIDASSHDK